MNSASKKAILVVSFGTSYENTRKLTIEAIEHDIADAFPACPTYRAWTSKMIIAKLKKRDGLTIHTVKEALEQMLLDGITDVIVQPTHVINGIENDRMLQEVMEHMHLFRKVYVGKPLLSSVEDYKKAIHAVMEKTVIGEDEMLVLMGHGTDHHANSAYPTLEYTFHSLGYQQVLVGTVESFPDLRNVMAKLEISGRKKVVLMPFMFVAGDHAKNDIAGEWKENLEKQGYKVNLYLKGLGENPTVQQLFIQHARFAAGHKAVDMATRKKGYMQGK